MNRPRAHRGRDQQPKPEPEPQPETPLVEAPKPPSAGPVEPLEQPVAESTEPATDPAPETPPVEAPPADPETNGTGTEEDEEDEEDEDAPLHPLTDLHVRLREILDYDQITEVRLALLSRASELEKHIKKATDLGVFEEDARRRLRIIQGEATRFGLSRIFEREEVTFQRDIFFDRERPNGRPEPEPTDAQVDEAVHAHVAELDQQEAEAAALAAETGAAVDDAVDQPAEGWDEGAPAVTPEGAERVAQAAGVTA